MYDNRIFNPEEYVWRKLGSRPSQAEPAPTPLNNTGGVPGVDPSTGAVINPAEYVAHMTQRSPVELERDMYADESADDVEEDFDDDDEEDSDDEYDEGGDDVEEDFDDEDDDVEGEADDGDDTSFAVRAQSNTQSDNNASEHIYRVLSTMNPNLHSTDRFYSNERRSEPHEEVLQGHDLVDLDDAQVPTANQMSEEELFNEVERLNNKRQECQQKMSNLLCEIERVDFQSQLLIDAEAARSALKSNVFSFVEAMTASGAVERVSCESDAVVVKTDTVFARCDLPDCKRIHALPEYEWHFHEIGKMIIRFPYSVFSVESGVVKDIYNITILNDTRRVLLSQSGPMSVYAEAPHSRSRYDSENGAFTTNTCWGGYAQAIRTSVENGAYSQAFSAILDMLRNPNVHDAYGKRVAEFPIAENNVQPWNS